MGECRAERGRSTRPSETALLRLARSAIAHPFSAVVPRVVRFRRRHSPAGLPLRAAGGRCQPHASQTLGVVAQARVQRRRFGVSPCAGPMKWRDVALTQDAIRIGLARPGLAARGSPKQRRAPLGQLLLPFPRMLCLHVEGKPLPSVQLVQTSLRSRRTWGDTGSEDSSETRLTRRVRACEVVRPKCSGGLLRAM